MPRDVGVVLVAAGQGTRLGGVPKQFRELAGVPVLLRSLRPFTAHPEVACVAVALPAASAEALPEWLAPLAGEGLRFVAGGAERTDSVAAGVAAVPATCAVVLVHDAARPLVSTETIDAVIAAARTGAGALAAVPLGDTLKAVHQSMPLVVERTVSREGLWRAQTPQGFPRALLERALAAARADGIHGTDDAQLVERIGGQVVVVADSPRNFKLTTQADFDVAEALLRAAR